MKAGNLKKVGLFGTLIAVVFVLSVADILISSFLEPKNTLRALPPVTIPLSGTLERPINEVESLAYTTDAPGLRIDFVRVTGRMWWGELKVDPGMKEGDYSFSVFRKRSVPDEETTVFTVKVFEDRAHYRASFKSLIRRHLGIHPWVITLCAFPLIVLSFVITHSISGRKDELLASKGIGAIYKLARRKDAWEIIFGLGQNHGIHPGDRLMILDENRQHAGELIVSEVEAEQSHALVDSSVSITPRYYVSKV